MLCTCLLLTVIIALPTVVTYIFPVMDEDRHYFMTGGTSCKNSADHIYELVLLLVFVIIVLTFIVLYSCVYLTNNETVQ